MEPSIKGGLIIAHDLKVEGIAGKVTVEPYDAYVLVSVTGDALSSQAIKSTLSKAVEKSVKVDLGIVIHQATLLTLTSNKNKMF